ncbi:MAG: hypothetical protein PF572_04455 [Patescibacteria group bacterium]|jgi:hypothetical protein|nr:hypothetical protein [Patescibacteria group bacterium]
MKYLGNEKGFTLIELIKFIGYFAGFFVVFGLIGGFVMGNFWVGEESALKAVQHTNSSQKTNPPITKVTNLDRNIWAKSKAYVEDSEGNRKIYYIDSCLMQNKVATQIIEK